VKALFVAGLVVLILGVLSLVVPIPSRERSGVSVGDVSIGVTTSHDEKVAPIVSAVMILGGAGMLITARRRKTA
jgi:hypothetical protein